MPSLNTAAVGKSFDEKTDFFDKSVLPFPAQILVWFSGKDLMASLDGSLKLGRKNPGDMRAAIRYWMRGNPDKVIQYLPEWGKLVQAIREALDQV